MRKEKQMAEFRPAIVTPKPELNKCRGARFGVRKRTMALHLQPPYLELSPFEDAIKGSNEDKDVRLVYMYRPSGSSII
jgi:hypothetical protein